MLKAIFGAAGRRTAQPRTVAGVPVLSAGSHRDARDGACFMEYASYLAGEPWSDHPRCTHPLLAHLAREVNDRTSSAGRAALAPLIPTVIGITSDDPVVHPRLVARVVRTVLPVAARPDQVVLAVALIRAEQLIAELNGHQDGKSAASREVLAENALATKWAETFLKARPLPGLGTYLRRSAPSSISAAAYAAANAPHTDPDGLLRRLLTEGIAAATTTGSPNAPAPAPSEEAKATGEAQASSLP
ncbi:hypothetical protein Kfla_3882 [Kribbella flavida DSM 17836]|uniref:Uncharacterized protein n=1 Tax=Kribbella flavida (strain DSM 17836 / JCM 10339 / NBRC 14399) TaxID=479435 RepID=D2PQ11_KRIFD|nr:hypothetical protein [Kribbella flavida]ADB32935.1 hypothetical protein Kfla_3882 [Kribbella flavida DSM 17836]